jgi:hypothetical protein
MGAPSGLNGYIVYKFDDKWGLIYL